VLSNVNICIILYYFLFRIFLIFGYRNLGFNENSLIESILPFEGDYILEGRFGNTLRFGSTNKINTGENFWSDSGKNGDPITILTNGHKFGSGKRIQGN
jgi:hypothetical protein